MKKLKILFILMLATSLPAILNAQSKPEPAKKNQKQIHVIITVQKVIDTTYLVNTDSSTRILGLHKIKEDINPDSITKVFFDKDYSFNGYSFPPIPGMENSVSERELRRAGIKIKPDRLDLKDFDIDINNGVVKFSFTSETEGKIKVVIYNFFGEKVFDGTPVLQNGKEILTANLSQKQYGTYFLLLVQGNRSAAKKFRLHPDMKQLKRVKVVVETDK